MPKPQDETISCFPALDCDLQDNVDDMDYEDSKLPVDKKLPEKKVTGEVNVEEVGGDSKEDKIFRTRNSRNVTLKAPPVLKNTNYFQTDGSTNADNVPSIGKTETVSVPHVLQGFTPLPVTDNQPARVKRIKEFEKLTGGVQMDLTKCTASDQILNYGETLLASLDFNQIKDFPGSTDGHTIDGLIKVYLIQTNSGLLKLSFSICEGKYVFTAAERFLTVIESLKGSISNMSMRYSTEAKFLSQECSLIVQDSIVDVIAYRSGVNSVAINVDAASGSNARSINCCGSCLSLCFICCTQQLIWNPKCCGEKKAKQDGTKCCGEKKPEKFARFLAFNATEEFFIGKSIDLKPEEVAVTQQDTVWMDFPIYCGGCCLAFPMPLPVGQSVLDKYPVCYCCPKMTPVPPDDKLMWDLQSKEENEITVVLHYLNALDLRNHSCKLTWKSSQTDDVDAAFNQVRKFVNIIGEHRYKTGADKKVPTYHGSINLSRHLKNLETA